MLIMSQNRGFQGAKLSLKTKKRADLSRATAFNPSSLSQVTSLDRYSSSSDLAVPQNESQNIDAYNNFRKVHELINKSFTRTSSGEISVKDIKETYSVLIQCLKLTAGPLSRKESSKFFNFSVKKHHPWSFTVEKAVETMKSLKLNLEFSGTSTNISYEFKDSLTMELLQTFMDAKLLHSPDDKTRSVIKQGLILQPTPKGVSILNAFSQKMNINGKDKAPILDSSMNSMELICFERRSRTDAIVHSEYWNKLLFIQVMGPSTNFWSPNNGPDEIPNLKQTSSASNEFSSPFGFSFEFPSFDGANQADFLSYLNEKRKSSVIQAPSPVGKSAISESDRISPFHHRYFTNPDSDSHIQYYVSNKGVRLFKNKIIEKPNGKKLIINQCFSGKAMVQWLMDCTDLMHFEEAVAIANLFLKLDLIYLINQEEVSESKEKTLIPSRNALYTLTVSGFELARWRHMSNETEDYKANSLSTTKTTGSDSATSITQQAEFEAGDFTLPDILNDPGMKYLFRTHLKEEFSTENLEVYTDIKVLERKINILKKLLKLREKEKLADFLSSSERRRKITISTAVIRASHECLTKAYNIYSTYLVEGAAYEVNVNSRLKKEIGEAMCNPTVAYDPSMQTNNEPGELRFQKLISSSESVNATVAEGVTPVKEADSSSIRSCNTSEALTGTSKNLTIDMQKLKLVETEKAPSLSPTDFAIGPALNMLVIIKPLFEEVKDHLYTLMERDSLPKFLNSEMFKEIPVTKIPKKHRK